MQNQCVFCRGSEENAKELRELRKVIRVREKREESWALGRGTLTRLQEGGEALQAGNMVLACERIIRPV